MAGVVGLNVGYALMVGGAHCHSWGGGPKETCPENLPDSPDFCPLASSVLELRKRVKEHVVLSKQDIIQGLGWINLGNTAWWPQTSVTDVKNAEPSPAVAQVTCGIAPLSGDITSLPTKLQ